MSSNVSRETIMVAVNFDNSKTKVKCQHCQFVTTLAMAVIEDWKLEIEADLVLCPFCHGLVSRGAEAPVGYCLSSPTNLNTVEGNCDEEIPF